MAEVADGINCDGQKSLLANLGSLPQNEPLQRAKKKRVHDHPHLLICLHTGSLSNYNCTTRLDLCCSTTFGETSSTHAEVGRLPRQRFPVPLKERLPAIHAGTRRTKHQSCDEQYHSVI